MYVPEELLEEVTSTFERKTEYYSDNIQNYGLINEDAFLRVNQLCHDLMSDVKIDFVTDEELYGY